jgi:hypothetical protein
MVVEVRLVSIGVNPCASMKAAKPWAAFVVVGDEVPIEVFALSAACFHVFTLLSCFCG